MSDVCRTIRRRTVQRRAPQTSVLLGLERQIRATIPLDHPILSLLAMHAAFVRTL